MEGKMMMMKRKRMMMRMRKRKRVPSGVVLRRLRRLLVRLVDVL